MVTNLLVEKKTQRLDNGDLNLKSKLSPCSSLSIYKYIPKRLRNYFGSFSH